MDVKWVFLKYMFCLYGSFNLFQGTLQLSIIKGQFNSWTVGLKVTSFESSLCAASHQQPEIMCAPGDLAEVSRLLARGEK